MTVQYRGVPPRKKISGEAALAENADGMELAGERLDSRDFGGVEGGQAALTHLITLTECAAALCNVDGGV